MAPRDLPARSHLDHLKNEAKALRKAFLQGDADAAARVRAVLGPRETLKLTEAQRVLAREYGFTSWARLRSHVHASRGLQEAVDAFLSAVAAHDRGRALDVLRAEPRIATDSLHVAAALGRTEEVQRLLDEDPSGVRSRAGDPSGEPLLWLCYSPFHGESPERDAALEAAARALLEAGADPDTRDGRWGVPALYAVTGERWVPGLARLLLEAGADPNDGESLHHAAEHDHHEALDLLIRYGADLNRTGGWGNTPLYFLLRYWDVEREPRVNRGLLWLLEHGADPDVPCGKEEESSLQVAARRGQDPTVVQLLLEHGADVHARRADGRTAWHLARRGGFDELATLLEEAGAKPQPLSAADALLAACGRGDADAARRLSTPELLATLKPEDLRLLPEAASRRRFDAVRAYITAGLPVDTPDDAGAAALHHACIHGSAPTVRTLLHHGADFRLRDGEHRSTPMGWACFGADYFSDPDGDYEDCVRALLEAGARHTTDDHPPEHAGVREVLRTFGEG